MNESLEFILPDWPAPARVHACATTRRGGLSRGGYSSLNLGDHVEDLAESVSENRRRLRAALDLPSEPAWLRQVHGVKVTRAEVAQVGAAPIVADAAWTDQTGSVCVILSADCLPVLLCDRRGKAVAAAHAGWRGLAGGVLENTVAAFGVPPARTLAWLGPAIGPTAFEVGDEVRQAFLVEDSAAGGCFSPSPTGRWLADLYELARRRLRALGIERIYGGDDCTYRDPDRFYSFRRDGRTGRMASLIWLAD